MMGELSFFIRIQIKQASDRTFISEIKYTKEFQNTSAREQKNLSNSNEHLNQIRQRQT